MLRSKHCIMKQKFFLIEVDEINSFHKNLGKLPFKTYKGTQLLHHITCYRSIKSYQLMLQKCACLVWAMFAASWWVWKLCFPWLTCCQKDCKPTFEKWVGTVGWWWRWWRIWWGTWDNRKTVRQFKWYNQMVSWPFNQMIHSTLIT